LKVIPESFEIGRLRHDAADAHNGDRISHGHIRVRYFKGSVPLPYNFRAGFFLLGRTGNFFLIRLLKLCAMLFTQIIPERLQRVEFEEYGRIDLEIPYFVYLAGKLREPDRVKSVALEFHGLMDLALLQL